MSDIEYDGFDYDSSQDPFELEYQIEQFYFHLDFKSKKHVKKASFSISSKTAQFQSICIKLDLINCKKVPSSRKRKKTNSNSKKSKSFEYEQTPSQTKANVFEEPVENFSHFRRQFYQLNRRSINKKPHPSNTKAPIIQITNGAAYGTGVYCSYTASYSLGYSKLTNTLLACAAIPKQDKNGHIEHHHGNILVLPNISQIIPLFLVDFQYLNQSSFNYPWFKEGKLCNEQDQRQQQIICLRKYFQKILNYMNDQVRNNNRYQLRMFNLHD
ncbi:hypothetical protein I4U23_022264 [Adineta vaga]|nr:hypothetical protein I4U23_022264 [Adineta vaga]